MGAEATALAEAPAAGADELCEEQVGSARLDGERHLLVWIHNATRSVSVLIDRPAEGADKVRLLGRFFPEETIAAVRALIADYRAHHLEAPASERIAPRPLEPKDLLEAPLRPGGERRG